MRQKETRSDKRHLPDLDSGRSEHQQRQAATKQKMRLTNVSDSGVQIATVKRMIASKSIFDAAAEKRLWADSTRRSPLIELIVDRSNERTIAMTPVQIVAVVCWLIDCSLQFWLAFSHWLSPLRSTALRPAAN